MNHHRLIHPFLHLTTRILTLLTLGILSIPTASAAPPDLTATGVIATIDRSETYNLGPTGLRGWIHITRTDGLTHGSNGTMTGESRQILVTVASAPADTVLAVDDVILGAMAASTGNVPLFSSDARKAFGTAITEAEKTGGGTLRVKRWRAGTTTDVNIPITILGDYAATAPYSCPKSALILANARNKLVADLKADANFLTGSWDGAIKALALLASVKSDDPDYDTVQSRLQTHARNVASAGPQPGSLPIWTWAYNGLFLAEYYLLTSDANVLPGIQSYTLKLVQSQSIYGTYGHGPAFPRTDGSGRRVATGYGPVNAAGIVANMAIFMGKKALVAGSQAVDPEINTAIQRGSDYFKFYVNKGSIPYGEHEPGTNGHTSNGKDPMCAVFFGLQPDRATETEYYARMTIASYNGREYGHTGQGFSYMWSALGANMGGTLATAEHLKPVRWHLDLSRRTDGSFAYDGAEQYGGGSTSGGTYLGASGYYGLNTTASYLLTYSLPLQRLNITGKRDTPANPTPLILDASTVAHAISAGNFKIDCPSFTTAALISSLSNYDPIVRHYAAIELGNRSATITPAELTTLRALLTGTDANARMGAAQALGLLQDSTALPTIVTLLNDTDIWVRAKAAVAIRAYPSATASTHRDPMMTSFIANATNPDVIDWNDPLQMGNGKLSMAVFGHGVNDGTPGNDIAAYTINAPKASLLYPALRAGLQQPDSYVRTGATQFAKNRLSLTDTQAIYPSVAHAAAYDTPADRMWSNASRADAIELLANLKISDGIALALSMLENPFDFQWGSHTSTIAALNGLASYGDAARYTLPTLKGYLTQWNPGGAEYPVLVSTIEAIENATTAPAQSPGLCVANSKVVTTTGSTAITLTGSSPRGSFTCLNVTQPAHGTLTGTAPNLTYTPTGGYTGPDSFTFQTTDTLTTSGVATVGIIVGTAGNGLKGEYFDNANFTNLKLTRTDAQVNFDWGTGTPDASIAADTFSVRWSGVLLVPQTGNYTFSALTSDGVRLYINGQLVIDRFVDQSTRWTDSTPVYLIAGQYAEVYMEYYENTGSAVAKLKWTGPAFAGANGNFIPQTYLFDGSGISNRPAYAFPQSLSTNQNTALPILLNGSGGTLSYTVLTQPTNGNITGTAPNLTYTPNSNFSGTDSFTFLVHNGTANSLPATVSINVRAGALTSFTWVNAVSGNWSDGTQWTPSAPAATGQPYYALNFTTAGTYTATHNLNNGFQLNQLNVAANVTLAGTQGVSFAANGGALPQLNQNGANEVRVDHPVSLQSTTTLGGSGGGAVVLNGVVSGTGGIVKTSPATLRIGQNNSYSGGTTLHSGTLVMEDQKDSALGSGPITLHGGTLHALRINTSNPIIAHGGRIWADGGWGGSWNGPVTLNGNLTVHTGYYDRITLNGNITGTGGLIAEGDTVPYNSNVGVFLTGTNTYTGKTTITSGMWLHCSSPAALGSGAVEISGNAKLDLNFTGTRSIASLTLDGVTKTPGTYGSTASNATHKNDTYFSGTGTVTVLPPTTTSLNLTTGSSPAPSGSSLTFTATVTGSSPTGNVQFFTGTTLLGSSALNGSFQATYTTNQLAIGLHSITARYVGNSSNSSSNSAAIAVEITPAAPAAPTGLNATPGATNSSNISLSWAASAGAAGYYVKRSTTSGGPYTVLAYVTGATYQDTTVTPGVSYCYVVSALNAAGESADSNQATALVPYIGVLTDTDSMIVPEGGTNTFKVKLSSAPAAGVTVSVARSAGDADITVQSGGTLTFTNGNWSTWQTVTLADANDADALDGTATIACTPDNPSYATKTVTAIEDDTNSHTVTYNGNGSISGTPPVDASSPYPQGSTVTVLGNTGNLTKSGHSLAGWNTSSDGSGTTYAPGATFTMPGANVSLYPVWNHLPTADAGSDTTTNLNGPPPTYGWSYAPWTGDADSGISNAFPYTAAHSFGGNNGGSVTVNGVNFTENFNTSGTGWSIGGTKTDWTGNDDTTVTGNSQKLAQEFIYGGNPRTVTFTGLTVGVTYEATFFSVAWETGSRNQTFSATGGDSAFINQSVYNNNNGIRISCIYIATASSQQFTITPENGNTFHLYAMSNKDITQTFAATVNLDGSVGDFENDPLTTTWSQISGPAPAIITNPSAAVTTAKLPESGTYTLQLTANDGFGSASDTVTITVNPPIVYRTLTYNGNGNNGGTAPVDPSSPYASGSTVTVPGAGTLTRTGYTFSEWNTAANGSGTAYAANATFSITADTTLYAQWTVNNYTVTFDANGGSAANPANKQVTYGSTYGTLATTTRTGYSLIGWFTAASGGTQVTAASTVTATSNHTLYAQWLPDTYIVSYNGNGNTGGSVPANQNKIHDINLTLATNSGGLSKTGYTFTGWNTAANGTGTAYASGAAYTLNAPLTLYAQWEAGTDGSWLPTAAGPFNWSDSANWSGGLIASGSNRSALFTPNITAAQTVNLDAATTIGNITFTDSTTSSNDLTISGANVLTLARSSGAPVIDVSQSGRTLTISSNIAGSNGLQKNGAGKLTLSGANTFSGGVFINAGTLQITSTAHLGDSANVVTFAGNCTLECSSNTTLSQGFAINSGVTGTLKAGYATVTINNSLAGSGNLTVSGGGTSGGYFEFTSTNNTFSGDIAINSYSGAAYPGGLTLASLNDTPGSRIKMSNTGIFNYGAGAVVPLVLNNRQIENANIAVLNNNATNVNCTVTVNTDLILSGTVGNRSFTLGGSNIGNNTFAGAITNGAGYVTSLTKANAGNWILSNANNSYTGATTINGGTLSVSKMENYGVNSFIGKGTSGVGIAFGGGALNYTGTGGDTDRLVQVSAGNGTILNNGTGALNFTATGNFNVQGSTTSARTLSLGGTNGGTISGAIQNNNTGTIGLTKTGSGTWKLSGANTYTGTNTVSSGTLQFGKVSSLYNGTTTSWTAANIRVANGGTLAFNVGGTGEFTSTEIGTLFTNLANSTNATTNGMAAGSRFGFDTTNASGGGFEISQAVTNSGGTAGGARGLTKLGTGTLVLSAANTYTGATTIHGGTLSLTGATQATTAITFTGGSLGLNTGITVTASSAAVNLTNGTIQVTGSTGAASYTLLTAASITGTPTLASPVSGYILQVVGGNQLRLVQQSLFNTWASASGLSGGNATTVADPDGDGLTNLQEFAFGTSPTAALSGPLEFVPGAEVTKTGSPVLRGYTPPQGSPPYQAVFGRRKNHVAAGLTYAAEFSANLSYWTPSSAGLSVLTGAGSHEIEVVAVPFPDKVPLSQGDTEGSPPKFFRVAVSQN